MDASSNNLARSEQEEQQSQRNNGSISGGSAGKGTDRRNADLSRFTQVKTFIMSPQNL